jgi:hypothetical protein
MRTVHEARSILEHASRHEQDAVAIAAACRCTRLEKGETMTIEDARQRLRCLAQLATDAEAIAYASRVLPVPPPPPIDPDDEDAVARERERERERQELRDLLAAIEREDSGIANYRPGVLGSGWPTFPY